MCCNIFKIWYQFKVRTLMNQEEEENSAPMTKAYPQVYPPAYHPSAHPTAYLFYTSRHILVGTMSQQQF